MGDRWNEDRNREGRQNAYRGDRNGADAYEGREDRSFEPGGGGRGVFGEREAGASYTGPRYGAGGYSGYGSRSSGERNYATGPDRYSTERAPRGYGAEIYQERSAQQVGGRFYGDQGRSQGPRQTYGRDDTVRSYDAGLGADYAYNPGYPGQAPRREPEESHREQGFGDRVRRFFGRDDEYAEQDGRESHRGRGPQGYRRTDARISEDVHDRLTEDHHIDASAISVTVRDGEVTLSGTVRDRHEKHHAEHIIETLSGVTHVQNNIRVETGRSHRGATTNSEVPLGENTKLSDQAAGKA